MTHIPPLVSAAELAARNRMRLPNESGDYRRARTALLAEEIELRRHIERVAEQRRALPPGGEVSGDYRFQANMARSISPACSATSKPWSSTATCSARSVRGPARCAPRC